MDGKFIMPKLGYAADALAPVISEETIKLHYGKHLQTYVDNLNRLVAGSAFEGKSLVQKQHYESNRRKGTEGQLLRGYRQGMDAGDGRHRGTFQCDDSLVGRHRMAVEQARGIRVHTARTLHV